VTDFRTVIDALDVGDMEKRYLAERWLDQVQWLGRKAGQAQLRYYGLRLTTMIGAVLTPALASGTALGGHLERWHNYRRTVERLKSLGWQFFELGPGYSAQGKTHAAAFPFFVSDVEQVLQSDVDTYLTKVTAEPEGGGGPAAPG